ncbi:hypothetical protein FBU30_001486 [Linnemannia zychae]|nr:hypothetical protein FBU30_001486 [Linnemannia zychae]
MVSPATPRALLEDAMETPLSEAPPTLSHLINCRIHHSIAVNQKAVLQPVFKYRTWLGKAKQAIPEDGTMSITEIESHLPSPHGLKQSSSTTLIFAQVEDKLIGFYNGAGKPRDDTNHVLIGVGLGKFQSTGRLLSLYSSFLQYFVPLARSLGYIVAGINEYYTSKKCPDCHEFVAQVPLRQFYCPKCQRYRDIMAAENMSVIAQSHLVNQERPLYLQLVTKDDFFYGCQKVYSTWYIHM